MNRLQQLGAYELLGEIGRGGMGTVYRARRRDHPARDLALKVLRSGADRSAERFAREQEVLAHLDHPAIVRWLDSGQTPEGDAYFVMELVDGVPIDRYCEEQRLGLESRIRLLIETAAAVSHAHRHLVLHRDLKPSNILVGHDGRPRLLDFGIAKWLDGGEGRGQETTRGASPMTLLYASPEQVRGERVGVGTDVYSLTLLLFELLTGDLPRAREGDLVSLAIAIARAKPHRASVVAREQGHLLLAKTLTGDLDAILAKGLATESRDRYPTVAALVADLERYLRLEPVEAGSRSWRREIRLFVRRHRLGVSTAAVFLLLLLGTGCLFAWQAQELERQRAAAEQAQKRAEAQVALLGKIFAEGDPVGSGPQATLVDALDIVRHDIESGLSEGRPTGSATAAMAAEAYWRLGEINKAGDLAETALRSKAPLPSRELAMLMAIEVLAQPRPGVADWRQFAAGFERCRRSLEGESASPCVLDHALVSAFGSLGASPELRSLALEGVFECTLAARNLQEARALLAKITSLRSELEIGHPARQELDRLEMRVSAADQGDGDQALP